MNKSPGTSTPTKPPTRWVASPNTSARSGGIRRIVLHYTTSNNLGGVISWFQKPASKVSAHYVLARNGELVQMVPDHAKAWHAAGENNDSIGIEICAEKGDKLTPDQTRILVALLRWLLAEYHLPATAITAHRFTPSNKGRTDCPGDLWKSEAELQAWVKVWVQSTRDDSLPDDNVTTEPVTTEPKSTGKPYAPCPVPVPFSDASLQLGSHGGGIYHLQCALIGLGYLAKPKDGELIGNVFNEHVEYAVKRFQRDVMKEHPDGIVGPLTRAAIESALIRARAPVGSEPKPAPTGILDVPYFSQRDYGGSLAWSICGITSAAMLLEFWGEDTTPDKLLLAFGKSAGQAPNTLERIYELHSLKADSTYKGSISDLERHTREGRPCVVHGYFTGSGHILVVCGFDGDDVICNDPAGEWEEVNGDSYADNPKNGKAVRYSRKAFIKAVSDVGGSGDVWYSVAWR